MEYKQQNKPEKRNALLRDSVLLQYNQLFSVLLSIEVDFYIPLRNMKSHFTWLRAVLLSTFLLFVYPVYSSAQSGGFSTGRTSGQYGLNQLKKTYGYDLYKYTFEVRNGLVSWTFSGPSGGDRGRFSCNPSIEGDIVTAECVGVVEWQFAARFIWELVEKIGSIDNIRYKWAMSALESAVSCFDKAKKTSPKAYERVYNTYKEIKDAEKGKGEEPLWDVLMLYSYIMSEHDLVVEDLHDYNF